MITYKRKKAKGVRQAIFSQFTPEIVHHELQGKDCTCPDCHGQLKEIGSTIQRQELVFIPAQLKRIDHVQHSYKCQACSQKNLSDKIIKAPVPKAPLAHSLGSASIIAHTIHQKFNLKVPNYRQEEDWNKLGLPISRKEIANWHIKSSQYYFEPIYNLLHEKLLEQPILHADETSYKVLENDSQLTFYWTFLSGKHEKKGITLYHHDKRRSGLVVEKFLGDYAGYVHCDMWSAYLQLDKAQLVGCWAHVRRKFFDWCRNQAVLPGSKLGNAIEYSLKYETTFRTVLSDGDIVLSNNIAERAMKTLVMGRKNWLFSQSFEGAKSTAVILSLLETAKRHGLDAEKYMTYLLEHLPNEETLAKKEVLEAYLPWDKNIKRACNTLRKSKSDVVDLI
ncbi:IS66 family transposase [Streptococcus parasuis]|uniref:IS66 family transposase n=1 Tax=Streptococcus TaxID=1301 RepID=UPI002082E8A7|nr:IS66 family transposase [Streptococcus suis]BCP62685.1 transposase [Streptococcus parasuis]GIC32091.1 transposase [Streptococcus parasuis]